MKSAATQQLAVFPSKLGWVGLEMAGEAVCRLSFGHPSAAAAERRLGLEGQRVATAGKRAQTLVRRLQAYAAGTPDDFRDVPVDFGPMSGFRKRILEQCRRIP